MTTQPALSNDCYQNEIDGVVSIANIETIEGDDFKVGANLNLNIKLDYTVINSELNIISVLMNKSGKNGNEMVAYNSSMIESSSRSAELALQHQFSEDGISEGTSWSITVTLGSSEKCSAVYDSHYYAYTSSSGTTVYPWSGSSTNTASSGTSSTSETASSPFKIEELQTDYPKNIHRGYYYGCNKTIEPVSPTLNGGRIYDITWSKEQELFVAVGEAGTIMTRQNGKNWGKQAPFSSGRYTDVIWNGSQWLVWNSGGTSINSDLKNWRKIQLGFAGLYDVIWVNDRYYALAHTQIIESQDGVNWGTAVEIDADSVLGADESFSLGTMDIMAFNSQENTLMVSGYRNTLKNRSQ